MRILVTGASGQLGHDVVEEIKNRGHDPISASHSEMDITNKNQVEEFISKSHPDAIIHCAAWTAVDDAEDPDNLEKVRAINVEGTRNLVNACKRTDAKFIYISTDYVFGGDGETPWDPDEKNFSPINVYGQSKLDGERIVSSELEKYFVVRIAWVFGRNGKNFVDTMINVGKNHPEVRVVCDQIGTPTYTVDLARLLVDMAESNKYGFYHATNEGGYISWADFAKEIYRQANMANTVIPVSTEEYGISKAKRPKNSRLDKTKLSKNGFAPLPIWQDALRRYLDSKIDS